MPAAPSRTAQHLHMRPVVRPRPRPSQIAGAATW
ncbi:MAG: hypothetical protein QOD55_40 [Solirubrobacteraceae bacterium]|jgi:hypothetical protein|nr:hypothetical protein [Solirubrobacteraceae bacterium]MEA2288043.1 hypothetical protein [Solirubrobacteraceae bacterium]